MAAETALAKTPEMPQTKTLSASNSTQKKKLPANKLVYEGQSGQVFKLWLVNLFMRIITLGIYSFWGKTRLRKYIYGSFSLGGDRFEYSGTGAELFKGFLKVLPVLVIILGPIAFFAETHPAVLLLYIPFFYLFGVAIYGGMRYRFARTRWRGIRARLGGSAFKYANISALRFLLNVITLGFAIPYSDIAKTKYMFSNIYFGNVKAEFRGDAKRIYGAYIKSLFMTVGVLAVPALIFSFPIILEYAGIYNENSPQALVLFSALCYLFGIFLAIALIPVARCFYTAALQQEQMRGLVIGDLRFKSTVTAMKLFKFQLANILWIIFTLGLATAHVINRRARFFAEHTLIGGDLDTSSVLQGKDDGLTSGEGLEDALDIDIGFL